MNNINSERLKKELKDHIVIENIITHIEMIVDDDMRTHSCCSKEFTIDEQIFRLLTGYSSLVNDLKTGKQEVK